MDEQDQEREDMLELDEGEDEGHKGNYPNQKMAPDEPFQKPKRGRLDGSVLDTMAYELLQEMNDAINKDNNANKKGMPGMSKLGLVEKVVSQLKNQGLQRKFLEQDGLEMVNRFISKLPDGSWPLSSARSKILNLIMVLPTELDQLRSTNLGRTLSNLQTSPNEFKENKKLIQHIKDKWSRKICNISVEYTRLENEEKDLKTLSNVINFRTRVRDNDEKVLATKEEEGGEVGGSKFNPYEFSSRTVGHNFTVRPNRSGEQARNYGSGGAKFVNSEMQRHLMRCRRDGYSR